MGICGLMMIMNYRLLLFALLFFIYIHHYLKAFQPFLILVLIHIFIPIRPFTHSLEALGYIRICQESSHLLPQPLGDF